MRIRFLLAMALCLGAMVLPARAQESLDELEPAAPAAAAATGTSATPLSRSIVQVNGYVDNRFAYTLVHPNALVSTVDLPSLQELLEGNVQLRVNLGRRAFAYADLSLFYQNGWLYYTDDGRGGRKRYPEHDVPTLHPFFVPSELYVSWSPTPAFNLVVGKKRIVWGSGFAFNPTDLINPPKDPTDPNLQRSGQWVARADLVYSRFTVSALFAPEVLAQASGVPYAVMADHVPASPDGRIAAHTDYRYLTALRFYALWLNSDINLMIMFANKYNDELANATRAGFSFSRYFFGAYELHAELLLQFGTSRLYPVHACVTDGGCTPDTAFAATRTDQRNVLPRLLVGTRTQFRDESLLSIEYYYQGDGYSDIEFHDALTLLSRAHTGAVAVATPTPPAGQNGSLPQRLTFDPLRRHYLVVSYTKPKIHDDWTVGAVLIAGLRDLSGVLSPSVTWNAREWLALSLYGYIPIRGIPVGQVAVDGALYSEYSLMPMDLRVLFEARAYY